MLKGIHLASLGNRHGQIESIMMNGEVARRAQDTMCQVTAKSFPKLQKKINPPNIFTWHQAGDNGVKVMGNGLGQVEAESDGDRRHQTKIEAHGNRVDSTSLKFDKLDGSGTITWIDGNANGFVIGGVKPKTKTDS